MDPLTHERWLSDPLIPALSFADQAFLKRLATEYRLSFEEVRHLAQAARDLEMWREMPLDTWWKEIESELQADEVTPKTALLEHLDEHLSRLRTSEKNYPTEPLRGLTRGKAVLVERRTSTPILSLCPFFSEGANCCGLYSLDAASGCALGCSFCAISAVLGETVEFPTDLAQRLSAVELNPDRFYHVSTGEFTDSLVWGNRNGMLDILFDFARRHPNVQLELKTKTDRIDYLLEHAPTDNILCTWLLNSETIIRNEEPAAATLRRRLQSARAVAHRGYRVGFHIKPLVYYSGWRAEYASLAGHLLADFSPDELAFVALGVMWFNAPVIREIRRRGGESKVLQMPLVEDPKGKLTYPMERRVELYSNLYKALQPWHGQVFFFLCMETAPVCERVLGRLVPIGAELERRFRSSQLNSAA